MKFVVADEARYWWPVTVNVPSSDKPGRHESQSFQGEFRALLDEEADRWSLRAAEAESARDLVGLEKELIRDVLVGWDDGVVAEGGAALSFGPDALEAALRFPWFRRGVLRAYRASLGEPPAEKN